MTRRTNARLAGFFFLLYIATGLSAMVLMGRATSGQGIPAKLASIAQHASDVRLAVLLMLLGCFSALVLAVTWYIWMPMLVFELVLAPWLLVKGVAAAGTR